MWAALPAGCERVEHEIAAAPAGPSATVGPALVVCSGPTARERAASLRPGSVLAVDPPDRGGADAGRLRLAGRALDVRPSLAARRTARALAGAGLETWWLDRGDPARRHRLVSRPGRPAVRPGRRPVVLAARGGRPPAAVDRILEAAADAPPPQTLRVLASGTVMAEVRSAGADAILRVAGGPAGEALERAAERQRQVRLAGAALAAQVPAPLAGGREGLLAWTLEERRPGTHPDGLGEALLADCIDFLGDLWAAPAADREPWTADRDAAVVAPVAGERRRGTLERVARALDERLAHVGRGWMHGDFHAGNVLEQEGRLNAVLDWDGAESGGLPLLDLLHLLALSDPGTRRLPHGARAARMRRTVAGDPRIAALGGDLDGRTLEALAVAYWLVRAARDLREFADRAERPAWLEANVRGPLEELEAAGW